MAEHDDELTMLKARVAELEARPSTTDLDWLKNSQVWKRAEFAVSPIWTKINLLFIGIVFFLIVGAPLVGIWWKRFLP